MEMIGAAYFLENILNSQKAGLNAKLLLSLKKKNCKYWA
jgi:hypothetical protein